MDMGCSAPVNFKVVIHVFDKQVNRAPGPEEQLTPAEAAPTWREQQLFYDDPASTVADID